jgi:hypothetical protein
LTYYSKYPPLHFILFYKEGMPLCRVVQAAGQAMGEQAATLRKNGFDSVTILTQPQDYDAICKYPDFLKEIKAKMDAGDSLSTALQATFSADSLRLSWRVIREPRR